MTAITELARAKVNLTLRVHGRRADGYHEIASLITFTDVGDRVHLEPGEPGDVRASGPFAAAITGPNLVGAALARLADAEPRLALGSVTLDKRLPVAAGLGGGSADAAALLRAVSRANPALTDEVDWVGIAAALGADVPVCLGSEPAWVSGLGEKIMAIPALPQLAAVLVNPLVAVPADKTARVFAKLEAPAAATRAEPQLVSPIRLASVDSLLALMRAEGNDLLAAATMVVPEIADVQAALRGQAGCLFAGLSGAGPSSFGVFASRGESAAAAASLQQNRPNWWVTAAVLGP
ncbi:MAG TPA: 4-(cytidine 5'-diphospho)-2-C-methyl-D-erythritol kinase [Hyphomicrobium sp.]